jgi:hypothetical protein
MATRTHASSAGQGKGRVVVPTSSSAHLRAPLSRFANRAPASATRPTATARAFFRYSASTVNGPAPPPIGSM